MKVYIHFFSSMMLSMVFFYSCALNPSAESKKDFLTNQQIPDSKKIKLLLEQGHPSLSLPKEERQKLYQLYQNSGFQPFFDSTTQSEQIQQRWTNSLSKAMYFGLPESRKLPELKGHRLVNELLINYYIGTTIHDLDSGFIDFEKKRFKPKKFQHFPINWLVSHQNTDSLCLTRGPADSNYRYFAKHLYHFCDTATLASLSFQLTTEKEDRNLAWKQLQSGLKGLGYIDANTDSLGIRAALKNYQRTQNLNPDGRIGKATVIAFGQSQQEQLYHAQISLDRLRQAPVKPKKYVSINLPSFELQFIADGALRAIHRVIIGKIEHPTPELSSKIYQIVSLPYWRVPSSIAKNEILPALKRNPNYLEKEHMRIYGAAKKEIDPKTVNWKNMGSNSFPYTIEQDPGPWNSLGLIKFEFSNQFSVYVHDTPSRSLFRQNFRSFSHGCMRADDPIELGKLFLTHDKIGKKTNEVTPDSLQSLIDSNFHQKIPLLQAIPIFVTYQTVTSDRNRLYFHLDLYRREQDLIALFRSKNNG